ncbi:MULTISPECIES: sugar porter family MFS transporter [Acidithiobacillus]|uniref:Sugar porter family MFS transporter n=1 Tax=Acidithiobacillus ferruginosus TaxID=3063951 RepID=A0ACD5IJ79_9PROT|nr:sugar porter family MFS transporter [Acidithiobacillus ferruginosus]MBU2813040.1 sugar porter family MFS transporter [Acidithiobacillus ferruginosus]
MNTPTYTKVDSALSPPKKDFRFLLMAIVAGLGGLLFGYDSGVVAGVLLFLRGTFHLSASMLGLFVAIALGAAAVGAAFAGVLSDTFGRRPVLIITAIMFILGALLAALSESVAMLFIGRIAEGAAIGVSSVLTPLYLAEIAATHWRGAIVTINQFYITFGIFLSYLVDYALSGTTGGWRWMLGLGAVPGVILLTGMLVLPESPRWLAGHNLLEKARVALRFLRGSLDVQAELDHLHKDVVEDGRRAAPWVRLLQKDVRKPLIIGVGLAIFQQITGINAVIYFAPTIFQDAGLSSASVSILATVGVGAVNVIMTLVSMRLMDSVGRRKLLLWGLCGMLTTLIIIGLGFTLNLHGTLSYLVVFMVAAFVGFFAIGLGPVFWLLISEIFPLAIRGRGASIATIANWVSNMIVSGIFLDLLLTIGRSSTFFLYAGMTVLAILFTLWVVPETKGVSLEDIESHIDTL